MDHPNIIKQLGGAKALADALRERGIVVADVTVRSWTLTGRTIPAKYWKHIADVAAGSGISVSFEALASQVAA